ncbi:MAG TPA: CCA tRNA nucleotidyltransferase [Bryobacteraceae bacterium]|nr:CCA tRNA nucleotidyltransferase [Bryobacteraceae bacterium]
MGEPAAAMVLARTIVDRLRRAGHSALLVGGCVRDLLLGRPPKDFDVATSAQPDELLRLFPVADQVGAHFGVVLVRENGAQVEVATFRSDLGYADGRRPVAVHFEMDPRQDVLRRDFTINALLMDPVSGEIFDYVGGRADLGAKRIRAIGEPVARFREDHLRLLRAVRFAARLGFEIEPGTSAAIRAQAPLIHSVAAERVRDEIARILTEGGARRGFELLDETGLLQEVLPEIAAMKGVAQPPEFHPEGDVWTHTLIMLEGLDEPSLTLALGVLLHDVGKPATFRVAERIRFDGHVEKGIEIAHALMSRLRFPNHVIEAVEALIANHMKFMETPRMRESTLKRFMRLPDFEEHMALHRLDCLSSHGHLDNYEFLRRKQMEMPPEQLKPTPLLTGRDLIAAGYRPGPMFGIVLSEIEDAQLEGRISSSEEALRLARDKLDLPEESASH